MLPMSSKLYLRPNVVPEPLFDRWYAWPHLISPATAAMNITGRHIKIIDSYIQSPQIHQTATQIPKMLGGPFMDYAIDRSEDVKRLKVNTLQSQKDLIEFSSAITQLNQLLKRECIGYSMEPFYDKVPEALKGYVELTYDVNNQPSFRFFETLLYKSKYYNVSSQSIGFYLIDNDYRPFVLSTPRLDNENILHLPIPFKSKVIDKLFKMQRVAGDYDEIREEMNITTLADNNILRSFFTDEAPARYEKYVGDGIRTRYFGHACILVETKDISVLSDPVISYGYDSEISRYTYTDLPDVIDYVIITHNHQDHILFETMLQLRHKVKYIVVPRCGTGQLQDPSVKLMFQELGFENIIELDEMETLSLPNCKITGIPFLGEHSDLDIRTKLCYHVSIADLTILFAADSCNIESNLYKNIHDCIGDIDVLFVGMECDGAPLSWLYGPLLPEPLSRDKDQSRRLAGSNYMRAIDLVRRFNPKDVFVYAMGQEPWLNYIMSLKYTDESNPIIASNKLIYECKGLGMRAERLFGEKTILYNNIYSPGHDN